MDEELALHVESLRQIQSNLYQKYGLKDIYSNSKIYEIMIANELNHMPIAGHSGTRNGKTADGEFEYKHFKESSSNHSWTFNDYSDTVIAKLKNAHQVIFAHIDDTDRNRPTFDWYLGVDGATCSAYLKRRTEDLLRSQPKGRPNARRMINLSPSQIERDLGIPKTQVVSIGQSGRFTTYLDKIMRISMDVESITGISQIQTSNKLWEMLTAVPLGHRVLTEQSGHDAIDTSGNYYEYKVAVSHSWQFQDISDTVLTKYENDKAIILSVVDKERLAVLKIYVADSKDVVPYLRRKRNEKESRYRAQGKEVRRRQVCLSGGDLRKIPALEYSIGPRRP